jgi:puromycin-sensitive aminopeptidase
MEIVRVINQLCLMFPEALVLGESILSPILKKIGLVAREGDDERTWHLRGILAQNLAVLSNDQEVIEFGKEEFEKFKKDKKSIDPNLIRTVFRIANLFGDAYEFLWEMIENRDDPHIMTAACTSIGFCPVERMNETLERMLRGLRQNVQEIVMGFCANPRSGMRFWEFFQKNIGWFNEAFKQVPFTLPALIEYALGSVVDESECVKIEEFFKQNPIAVAVNSIQQELDKIKTKARIIARERVEVE